MGRACKHMDMRNSWSQPKWGVLIETVTGGGAEDNIWIQDGVVTG
jgi:hypothetical protein